MLASVLSSDELFCKDKNHFHFSLNMQYDWADKLRSVFNTWPCVYNRNTRGWTWGLSLFFCEEMLQHLAWCDPSCLLSTTSFPFSLFFVLLLSLSVQPWSLHVTTSLLSTLSASVYPPYSVCHFRFVHLSSAHMETTFYFQRLKSTRNALGRWPWWCLNHWFIGIQLL